MASLQELVAQKEELAKQQAELERQISETRRAERSGVINQIKAMMAEHGLTVADLGTTKAPKAPKGDGTTRKVAPKFRNPATDETWSGRGLKPKWLAAALESGRTLEEFAV
jgi:DNA-binding protein H-NS